MQLDKDTLIKHRFWILLGVVVPLILVVLIVLPASVGSSTEAKQKEVDSAMKGLDLREPKNPSWMTGLEKKEEVVTQQQKAVWGKAWEAQADVFTWPKGFEDQKNAYFGEAIDRYARGQYRGKNHNVAQAEEFLKIVQPVRPRSPRAVVLLRDPNPIKAVRLKPEVPTSEEIWLAQEDLWVQRELLQVVRDANDSVAKFEVLPNFAACGIVGPAAYKRVPAEQWWPAARKGDVRQRFYNPYWELDLTLTWKTPKEPVLHGTIKNISKRKLSLGFFLDVQFTRERQAEDAGVGHWWVDGEPVPARKDRNGSDKDKNPENVAVLKESPSMAQYVGRSPGLFAVEQVFTTRTAAVKRLDRMELFWPSHRLANATLKPARQFAAATEPKPGEAGDPGAGGATPLAGTAPPTQIGVGLSIPGSETQGGDTVRAAPGGGPVTLRRTESGLVRDRYLHVTDQVRRIPVALTVTVDQAHIPNVLAAFSNSRLRMQVTQVHMVHVRGDSLRIPAEGPGGPGVPDEGGAMPGKVPFPGIGLPSGRGERGSGEDAGGDAIRGGAVGIGGAAPPGTPGSGPNPFLTTASDEDEGNLVELTVYAIASLYERYPPRPSTPAGDAAAGKPAETPKP